MDYIFKDKYENKYCLDSESLTIFKYNKKDTKVNDFINKKIDYFRNRYFSYLTIFVCNDCNLMCSYCYERKNNIQKNIVINENIAKKVIQKLIYSAICNDYKIVGLNFFGGEPLLHFNIIKKLVQYSEMIRPQKLKIRYSIVTNGTLMNNDISFFLEKYNFYVTLSIDGNKDIHDAMRKMNNGSGSYNIIKNNLKMLDNSNLRFRGRITVNDSNCDITNSVQSVRNLGIDNIVIGVDEYINKANFEKFLLEYEKLLDNYFESIINGDFYTIDNIAIILSKIVFKRRISSKCNAGCSYFTLSSSGDIYGCHRFVGNKDMIIGNTEMDFLKKINEYSENMYLMKMNHDKKM